jgi:hypothetical protein
MYKLYELVMYKHFQVYKTLILTPRKAHGISTIAHKETIGFKT